MFVDPIIDLIESNSLLGAAWICMSDAAQEEFKVKLQALTEAPDGVAEALQRMIENNMLLGVSSIDDAILVAKYREQLVLQRKSHVSV